MLSITITGDIELLARLKELPAKVRDALAAKADDLAASLAAYVQQNKLSGQVLNVKSGALRDSITSDVTTTATGFSASVSSAGDLPYAAIQEYGGSIPAHEIDASNAKALAFMKGGKQIFATRVNWPGATLPERSYLRSALEEQTDSILSGLADALQSAIDS